MPLAIRGNDLKIFFMTNKPKIELIDRKWTQKSTLFCHFDVIFDHFGFKNSFSGDFRFSENFKVKYLYSLLPITDALLWGPAEALHQEKSVGF